MDTFFDAHDPLYAWLALGWLALDHFVLARRLPGMTWHWLHWPAALLHELTHFLTAIALGADARITSLTPRHLPDESDQVGGFTGRHQACDGHDPTLVLYSVPEY